MRESKYIVKLTENERACLHDVGHNGKSSARKVKRSLALLKSMDRALDARRSLRVLLIGGRLIDRRFRRRWKRYLLQCGLSTLALLLILLVMDVVLHAAVVVAIASSAFVVFVLPHSEAARPQRVVGGHVVAILASTALSGLYLLPVLGDSIVGSHLATDLIAVLSVGLSILLMVLTNTEHPPAAGTALGLVIGGWSPSPVLFVLLGAVILSVARRILLPRLTNLL